MKRKIIFTLLWIFCSILLFGQVAESVKVRVFYLGGQSNMNGYGYNKDLPATLNKTFEGVWIFQGNPTGDEDPNGGLGVWSLLKPGHGAGFSSDGQSNQYSDRFGVELSFAKRMQELFPGERIALIKYAKGGSSIDSLMARNFGSWEPDFIGKTGMNQYDYFLRTLQKALQTYDIDGDGQPEELIPGGILWMQGESDSGREDTATRYYTNLKRLMDLIRASLRIGDLPIVIGKISDSWNDKDGKQWDYGELVQHGQEEFVRNDVNAAIIRATRYYKYSDPWHYDSAGYIDLGKQFAQAIYQLSQSK